MKHSLYINSSGKVVRGAKISMGSSFLATPGMIVGLGTTSGVISYYVYRGDQWYSTLQP